MEDKFIFESLEEEKLKVLLNAHGYSVDEDGFILDENETKIKSDEIPSEFLKLEDAALVSGSLKVEDGSPTSISKLIREKATAYE